jgi:type IV pilus assembly protein PilY1
MNSSLSMKRIFAAAALAAAALLGATRAEAQLADIADVPLANSPSTSVLPNLMYVLDDSGSMAWNWMPDQIFRTSNSTTYYHCRKCASFTVSSYTTGAGGSLITASGTHGGQARYQVTFTQAALLPTGVTQGTVYYMRASGLTTTKFGLETAAGVQVVLTGAINGARFSVCSGPGGGDSSGTPNAGFPCGNDTSGGASSLPDTSTIPDFGDPPFFAAEFNKIWYNPNITYSAAVDSTGASLGNSNATAAKADYYTDPTTSNLTNAFQELVYCTVTAPTALQKADPNTCRYNGKHNSGAFLGVGAPTYFLYNNQTFLNTLVGSNAGFPAREFVNRVNVANSNAHYYNITANEHCSDAQLTTCALSAPSGAAPDLINTIPAPVRWCKTQDDTQLTTVVTGSTGSPATARCRKKFDKTTYPYPRFGRFTRVDIVPATATYPKGANATRSDCVAAGFCSYAEEIQNFANWYSFYRYRLSLMKTSTGKAFLSIDDRFRVGFITINPNSPVTASKFLGVGQFNAAQRLSFYTKLYAQTTNGGTPNREALSRVGRYYAGVTSGINSGMGTDPVQFSCQTNYALLTTDGYWNGNAGVNIAGAGIGNQDNANSGYTTRAIGAYDGALAGSSDTLADVAAYYYKTDLRTSGATSPDNVPTNNKDTNNQQHMVTFTLGLGLEGFMDYIANYDTSVTGDFAKIKAGTSGACSWTAGVCDWPVPVQNEPGTLDDLWHAAVNGRGQFFSASDPNSLALGLQSALAKLKVATAAASASATSSPNITQSSNFIFSSTFRTGMWDGEVVAQRIDLNTGAVQPAIIWSAQGQLDSITYPNNDFRTIWTLDDSGGAKKKSFKFASLTATPTGSVAAEQSYFANKCGALAQCTLLTTSQQAIANSGANLVDWLRGQRQYETFTAPETIAPFRFREHVLGDPVNANPAFMADPPFRFADASAPTYDTFQVTWQNRRPILFIGANDGMLHAFNANTGAEEWAYVPRITMPVMHKIANANWGATHRFTVDGSPQIMDAYFGGQWHSVLVAGLNGGGRGYYALDVTDPDNLKVLWEICSDPTVCVINDPDLGFSFGSPVITKRAFDGKWVAFVTSGLNNVTPGTGAGILFTIDLATGAILNRVSTAVGTTLAPSGLNDIAGFADDFTFNNTAKFLYGGDLQGNMWKFDTSTAIPTVTKLAVLKDGSGKLQPITSRPELAEINGFPVIYIGTGRYIGEDDLQDPATLVPAQTGAYQQSFYAIKDRGVTYPNFRTGSVVQNTIIDGGTTRTTTNNPVNWNTQDGWFVDFNPAGTSPGERVNLDAQLVQGTLIVITNVPNNTACTVGGDSWIYYFDYKNGTYVASSAGNVVATKLTGQIIVGAVVVRLPSGLFKGIATGATGEKVGFSPPIGVPAMPARRISWREIFSK